MLRQPGYRVAVGVIALLLLLPLAVGSAPQASRAAGMTTLTFLGPDFDEWVAFVKVANEIGKGMGIEVKPEYLVGRRLSEGVDRLQVRGTDLGLRLHL